MSPRHLVSYLTMPAVIALATLGYSCATPNSGEPAAATPPAPVAAAKTAAAKPAAATPAAKPQVLPSPPKLTAVAAPAEPAPKRLKRAEKAEKAEKAEIGSGRVTRYVAAQVLNIRSKPSTDGDIVGRLVKGSQLPVEIKGEWAKLGDSQFVQTKYLSAGKSMASK